MVFKWSSGKTEEEMVPIGTITIEMEGGKDVYYEDVREELKKLAKKCERVVKSNKIWHNRLTGLSYKTREEALDSVKEFVELHPEVVTFPKDDIDYPGTFIFRM